MGNNNFCGTFVFVGVAGYLNSTNIKVIHARQRRGTPPRRKNMLET